MFSIQKRAFGPLLDGELFLLFLDHDRPDVYGRAAIEGQSLWQRGAGQRDNPVSIAREPVADAVDGDEARIAGPVVEHNLSSVLDRNRCGNGLAMSVKLDSGVFVLSDEVGVAGAAGSRTRRTDAAGWTFHRHFAD